MAGVLLLMRAAVAGVLMFMAAVKAECADVNGDGRHADVDGCGGRRTNVDGGGGGPHLYPSIILKQSSSKSFCPGLINVRLRASSSLSMYIAR